MRRGHRSAWPTLERGLTVKARLVGKDDVPVVVRERLMTCGAFLRPGRRGPAEASSRRDDQNTSAPS